MNTETKTRNPVYDVAKFMVMLLVVAGHLTGNNIVASELGISYLGNMNIGVAMPLFFMISGYFAARTFEVGDVKKIVARIVGFLWPLAAFGVIFGFVLLAFGKITLLKAMLYPAARVCFGSWFLKTLAIIYASVAVVYKMIKPMRWRLFVLVAIYGVLFFTAGHNRVSVMLGLPSVLHMFPYFVFGVLALKSFRPHYEWRIAIPCGIFFLGVVFLEGDIRTNGMAFYWVPSDWQTVVADNHLFLCFWARTAVGVAGSIFVLWAVDKLLKFVPQLAHLAVFGTTTLGVYVLHEWPLVQVHKYFHFDPLPSCWRWPLALGLFTFCHYIVIAIRRHGRLNFIFFGEEKWLAGKMCEILNKGA